MKLSNKELEKLFDALKKEPLSIQEVSKVLGKSWVTTDTYLKQIKENTGLIDIKTFRKGSHGALKVVYYKSIISSSSDIIKNKLNKQIFSSKKKEDFDFFELYQHVKDENKKAFIEINEENCKPKKQNLTQLFNSAESTIYCFSGNMSFVHIEENEVKMLEILEKALKRKVHIKIICRINISTLNNLKLMEPLLQRYEHQIEIRHAYHPLRGFIIDSKLARFRDIEHVKQYKEKELAEDIWQFYEVYDPEWVLWLIDIFWKYYYAGINYIHRTNEIKKLFGNNLN